MFAEPPKRDFAARELGGVTHYNYAMFIDRVRVDGVRGEPERYRYAWFGTGPEPR